MQSGLLLYCDVLPSSIRKIRSKYDEHDLPAHITLAYLHEQDEQDEQKLLSILEKTKKFTLIFDDLIIGDDLIALKVKNTKKINSIIKKINIFVDKLPKSDFHMSLVYRRGHKKINKHLKDEILEKIKLPIEINITKIWLMKRNKDIGKDWYRSKTIKCVN